MILLEGKQIAEKILNQLQQEMTKKKIKPILAVVLIGDDPASHLYVQIKEKTCREVGMGFKKYLLPERTSQENLLKLINDLNRDKNISAIIVQLPLPQHLDTDKIISSISLQKDADGLNPQSEMRPPTVAAILEILKFYKISLKDRKVCLVGYGRLVGRPLAPLLKKAGAKLTICTRKIKNQESKIKNADIVISGVGVPNLIQADMVKKGAVVIDAGTTVIKSQKSKVKSQNYNSKVYDTKKLQAKNYKLKASVVGDVDFAEVKKIASYITPPRGGVGPLTVAKLLKNVLTLADK